MKVWLPSVRSNSGSDVFVERLADLLERSGCKAHVTWFDLKHELLPWRLKAVQPPVDADLIHANSWSAFAFSGHGLPLVVTVHHCVRNTGYPEWKGRLQALYHDHWIGSFEEKSFDCANAILCGSSSAASEVEKEFDLAGKIRTVEYWLDADKYCPKGHGLSATRRVLWVGNMSSRKGADLLAEFRQCLDPSIELNIVAGRRAQSAGLEQMGGNVKVWPRLSEAELVALYQSCEITVSLSRHEGFGYTALEAMACGRPVVAFDVTGLRDVVSNGHTGILCEKEDVRAVADACKYLIEQPEAAREMGRAGRARALERFAPQRAAEQYLSVYQQLLDTRSRYDD